jgi:hypothetical protein
MAVIPDPSTFKGLYINMQNDRRFYKLAFTVTIIILCIAIVLAIISIVYYNRDVEYRTNTKNANSFLTLLFPEYVNYSA